MRYEVRSSPCAVAAWSEARLPFEPRGWQLQMRDELRLALRALSPVDRPALAARYEAPDDTFVDLENVLLYNIGMAVFAPLISGGLTCQRGRSRDTLHHVEYHSVGRPPEPGGAAPFADIHAELGPRLPSTAGQWWAVLHDRVTVTASANGPMQKFSVDATITGPQLTGTRLANLIKPMLDGLVSCLHSHDGSNADLLRPHLDALGSPGRVWHRLIDSSTAILGTRTLIRPYRNGIMWNPGDDLCDAFRIAAEHAPT